MKKSHDHKNMGTIKFLVSTSQGNEIIHNLSEMKAKGFIFIHFVCSN